MKGRISIGLKKLLVKLLAFNPETRPKLSEVIAHDEWVSKGPNGKMLSQVDYWKTMHAQHMRIR